MPEQGPEKQQPIRQRWRAFSRWFRFDHPHEHDTSMPLDLEGGVPYPDQRSWGDMTRSTGGYIYLPDGSYEPADGSTEATFAEAEDKMGFEEHIKVMDELVAEVDRRGIKDPLSHEAIDIMIDKLFDDAAKKTSTKK